MPGKPDIVFARARVVVFCDGDFWHGRELEARLEKLARGHNAPYWIAKIQNNVLRDRRNNLTLAREGWFVVRVWESEIVANAVAVASRIGKILTARLDRAG